MESGKVRVVVEVVGAEGVGRADVELLVEDLPVSSGGRVVTSGPLLAGFVDRFLVPACVAAVREYVKKPPA